MRRFAAFLLLTITSALLLVDPIVAGELPSVFNGKDLAGWRIPANNIWFQAIDDVLRVANGPDQKGAILWTKQEYSNFILELEFRFGDGTVDSGIFLRKEQEQIQIGISGSMKRDMTGSPYIVGKGYPVEATGVKTLLNQDDWNQMTIIAKGNNYQVWLNGKHVLSYDSDSAATTGPVGIQLHQGRTMTIEYRDIRLAELS